MTSDQDFQAQIEPSGYECYRFRIKVPSAYGDRITRISVFYHPAWATDGVGGWRYSMNSHNCGPFESRAAASEAALQMLKKQAETLLSVTLSDLMPGEVIVEKGVS